MTLSRRRMLMALGAVPIAGMAGPGFLAARRQMTAGEALRFLCEVVFPTANQRLSEREGRATPAPVA